MQMQQIAVLFDHLVGAGQQGRRHSRPSALAVFRLITSSNLVGCMTGRSAGFSPLRMASVDADLTIGIRQSASVAHQATGVDDIRATEDRGHRMASR